MATKEEIKQELTKTEGYYEEAKKKLEDWEKGEDDGLLLKKLRMKLFNEEWKDGGEKKKWEDKVNELEEEKKSLEEKERFWRGQVEEWGKALRGFGGGEGNEQIAKKIIFRSFHFVYFSFIQFRLFIYSFALSTTY